MESRVANVAFESNEARCPIAGIFSRFKRANSPAFTFLEAIQDVLTAEELSRQETIHGMSREELESVCHTLMEMACEKKREMGARCPLNEHEIAALYLYTAEFFDGACYYAAVNGLLRDKNRTGIRPFTRIIWLTLLASSKCPPFTRHTLHRGIKMRSADDLRAVEAIYADGRTVTWGQFSSCSTRLSTQNNFLGQSGYRMLFNIEMNHDNSVPNTARMISHMSLMPSEEEVILPPNTRVFVSSSFSPSPDMVIVSLQVAPSLDNIFPGVEGPPVSAVPVPPAPSVVRGTKIFGNGNRYEGDLLDGNIRHGKGAIIFSSGNRYVGDWVNDSRTGKGEYTWANGNRYVGDFKDNKVHGKGLIILTNGNRYEGDWVNDARTGRGVLTWADGESYEGDFQGNKKHGKGTITFANGNRYEGDWINDSRTGKGVLRFANGDSYEGDFMDDKMHGKGTMIYSNGRRCEGDWIDDRMLSTKSVQPVGGGGPAAVSPVVGGAQQFLASQDWPTGLSATLLRNVPKVGMRYFIIDDSGSMATGDGHRIVGDRKKKVSVSCTRWVELADAMRFHTGLAYSGKIVSQFRLLNGSEPIVIGQPNDDDFSYRHFLELMDGSPNGMTPLCHHINQVVREIRAKEQHLRRNGQVAIVMIATDGESSDGDIAAALKPLETLPAQVIIRLCTDEDKIVSYWNNIDKVLELQLDILDDLAGEAEEVMTPNSWLTYGEPLHRMREFGVTMKEFDLLDEGKMSQDQIITFIGILFNVTPRDIPHPQLDWRAFQEFVAQKNREAGLTWNPLNKQFQHYINESQLSSFF